MSESGVTRTIKTLHEGKWLALKTIQYPGQSVIEYVHEVNGDGDRVAILPFKTVENKMKIFLVRDEIIPPWSPVQSACAITGMMEKNMTPLAVAKMELLQEGGYDIPELEFIPLGFVYGSKAGDARTFIFAVDLKDYEVQEASGDGTHMESFGSCRFTYPAEILNINDAQIHSMFARLRDMWENMRTF